MPNTPSLLDAARVILHWIDDLDGNFDNRFPDEIFDALRAAIAAEEERACFFHKAGIPHSDSQHAACVSDAAAERVRGAR